MILLLTADSVDTLLPTISSRCEILRLRPVPVQLLEKELQTRWHLTEENARLYAHISNGRTGLALQMAHSPDMLEKRKTWADEFFRLLPLNRRERFGERTHEPAVGKASALSCRSGFLWPRIRCWRSTDWKAN